MNELSTGSIVLLTNNVMVVDVNRLDLPIPTLPTQHTHTSTLSKVQLERLYVVMVQIRISSTWHS